jgi:hypothetical protein
MNPADGPQAPIRLFLELDRNDDPRLYDDLLRFKKGPKRVSRVRLLAHDGLLAQIAGAQVTPLVVRGPEVHPTPRAEAVARLTNQAFESPTKDERQR